MSNNMKICPACGKEIPALASFCPECGTRMSSMDPDELREREELEEAMEAETPSVDKQQLNEEMAKRRESYQKALEERKRRTRRMIPLVVLLVAGAIGGGLYAGSRVLNSDSLKPLSGGSQAAEPGSESAVEATAKAPETTAALSTLTELAERLWEAHCAADDTAPKGGTAQIEAN